MAHRAGKAGRVDSDTGAEEAGIKSWTLDYTVDMLETTDFADAGVKSYIPGGTGWSGSFEGFKEGQAAGLTTGAKIVLKLYETQESNEFWTGDAFITAVHVTVSFDGIVSYSYDFQGTGALTPAAA